MGQVVSDRSHQVLVVLVNTAVSSHDASDSLGISVSFNLVLSLNAASIHWSSWKEEARRREGGSGVAVKRGRGRWPWEKENEHSFCVSIGSRPACPVEFQFHD